MVDHGGSRGRGGRRSGSSRRGSLSSGSGLAAQGEGLAGLAHHADDLLDGDLVALLADALEDGALLLALHVEGALPVSMANR